MSTGAYTAKLIADSAPDQPGLQVGNRITACGVCEAAVNLSPKQVEKFKNVPAFVLDANKTQGIYDVLSLTSVIELILEVFAR